MLATGLLALGVLSVAMPDTAATMYGLPTKASAWVAAAGLRDAVFGLVTLALYAFYKPALLIFVGTLLAVPIGDVAITYSSGGSIDGLAAHACGTGARARPEAPAVTHPCGACAFISRCCANSDGALAAAQCASPRSAPSSSSTRRSPSEQAVFVPRCGLAPACACAAALESRRRHAAGSPL
eukprot:874685-Prymnesium_polylepis.1